MLRSTRMTLCEISCALGLATLLTWRWFSLTPTTITWPLICCLIGTTLSALILIADALAGDNP